MSRRNKPISTLVSRTTAHKDTRILVLVVDLCERLGTSKSCQLHELRYYLVCVLSILIQPDLVKTERANCTHQFFIDLAGKIVNMNTSLA